MRAIVAREPGGPEVLELHDYPDPGKPGEGELLVDVRATALNGADLLQRRGLYPPPPGESPIIGMECAGVVASVGAGVRAFAPGDRVMALLAGGGYATRVLVPAGQAMPIPADLGFEEAAGIPEVFVTAYLELVLLGGLRAGERVLIHAGASGVGTAAIQIARELGAESIVTAGSKEKLAGCRELGANHLVNYKEEKFEERVRELTQGRGVDVILDLVGASYLAGNLASLALDGRLLLVGLGSGAKAELDMRGLLQKRARIIGSTLRSRSREDKARIVAEFMKWAEPRFASRKLRPVVDRVYPLAEAAEAHRALESHAAVGKIVLKVTS